MKILTYILTVLAIVLIGYNLTQINLNSPFEGESMIALITIFAGLSAIVLLAILRVSKKIEQKSKQRR